MNIFDWFGRFRKMEGVKVEERNETELVSLIVYINNKKVFEGSKIKCCKEKARLIHRILYGKLQTTLKLSGYELYCS